MGVTLPTLANATVMNSATVFGAATTVRDWMNAGIALGDINGNLPTRVFKRGDTYPWGGVIQHWMGPSGGYWFMQYSDDVSERVVIHPDSHGMVTSGNNQYADVSEFAIRFKVPDAGYINVDIGWWCWAIGSNQTTPETAAIGRQAEFLTFVDGTAQVGTHRQLWDSGTDGSLDHGGPFVYPARQHAVSARSSVAAGWHGVRVKVNLRNSAVRANYPTIYVGARQILVEYERK